MLGGERGLCPRKGWLNRARAMAGTPTHAGVPRQDTHLINLFSAECAPRRGEGRQASGCSFVELWGCQKQGQHFRARVLEKIYRLFAAHCALYLGLILVYYRSSKDM